MSDTAGFTPEDFTQALANAGAQDPTAPFGVPRGYVPPIQTNTGFSPGNARAITPDDLRENPYLPGDDVLPVGQSPETITTIQQRLVDAGLLRGQFQVGVWDNTTRLAYRGLLSYANQLGTTDAYALDHWTANNMGAVDPTPPVRQPFVAEVTHPDDIKAVLRETFREKTGFGKITDADIDAMVEGFQSKQVSAQRQEFDLTQTGSSGGQVVRPPDLATFADQQAQIHDKTGYDSTKVADRFDRIAALLGGGQ